MYSMQRYMRSMETWQKAWWAYGKMVISANQVIGYRTLDMALGKMKPEEFTRMVFEKPATFAKSVEMASRAAAARRGHAASALASIKPYEAKTRSNSTRLAKRG